MISTSEAIVRSAQLGATRDDAKVHAPDALDTLVSDAEFAQGNLALVLIQVLQLRDIRIELGPRSAEAVVLQVIARIRQCLRPSDRVIRIGPGELALILPALRNHAQPLMAVSRIERALEQPISIGNANVHVRLACGLARAPSDAACASTLLVCAETALRHALNTQAPLVQFAHVGTQEMLAPLSLEQSLRTALEHNALTSNYEPIVDIETGDLVAVEMHWRWVSPEFGEVKPAVFVKVAEDAGLISPLTLWGFNTGLRESVEWQPVLPGLGVSINLSPHVLREPYIADQILNSLPLWGVTADQMAVEITEQSLMREPAKALTVLNRLHEVGVRIVIDDFGAEYSSLKFLKELPVNALKIDRSFVRGMLESPADRRIVKSVIDLAHNFELTVIADGVEDEETLDSLTLMGCQRAQGAYIAPPLLATRLEAWLLNAPWTLRTARHCATLR